MKITPRKNNDNFLDHNPNWHGRSLPSWRPIASVSKKYINDLGSSVLKSLDKVSITKSMRKGITYPPDFFMEFNTVNEAEFASELAPLFELNAEKGAAGFYKRNGLDLGENAWSVTWIEQEEAIRLQSITLAQSTTNTLRNATINIAEQVRQGLIDGTIDDSDTQRILSKKIQNLFFDQSAFRAQRIGMTESSRALHAAQRLAGERSGVVKGYRWLASSDACPICQEIASSTPTVDMSGSFYNPGGQGTYSQPIQYPPAHPFCMCTIIEILK